MIRTILFALTVALATPALAVQPDEKLGDPALEQRAREVSKGLRCLVCQNESIDDSNADLARDLRLLVRERIVAGDTNDETVQYIVDRYGEFVLLEPRFDGKNAILWLGGPLLLILGAFVAVRVMTRQSRRAKAGPGGEALSEDEQRKLDELLNG
jgi:cytochrome c-type biogenesis protein CcmH